MATRLKNELHQKVREFITADLPARSEDDLQFDSHPMWARLKQLGTELWLDTGSLEDSGELWTREFTALTTNNTLLNREIQSGSYDDLIPRAAEMLAGFYLPMRQMRLEMAFLLNAYHARTLVNRYDAHVSVEEHTDLANDVEGAISYARRYHEICPERFIVKIPFTPAGVLATRRIVAEGIRVNHTLGFSARQNYLVARIAKPTYLNVFMGRLNAFVASNDLGDGDYVGERATLASQATLRKLRERPGIRSRQIGASFRDGSQVRDLAGLDVMTMPPKVARQFLELDMPVQDLHDRTEASYKPGIADHVDEREIGLHTLWEVDDTLVRAIDKLEQENIDAFTSTQLVDFLHDEGCGDIFPRWTESQIASSREEGKIPVLDHWKKVLADGQAGLDALMNLAGLNSFSEDQKAMDEHVMAVIRKDGTYEPTAE